MVLNTTERALWLSWAQSRKLDSVWIAPHATNVDLIEIPGVEGSPADDVAFCDFIGEADKIGVDVQLFASPISLTGKGASEVDLRFAINCTKSMLATAAGAGRAPTRSANPPLTENSKPLFEASSAPPEIVGRQSLFAPTKETPLFRIPALAALNVRTCSPSCQSPVLAAPPIIVPAPCTTAARFGIDRNSRSRILLLTFPAPARFAVHPRASFRRGAASPRQHRGAAVYRLWPQLRSRAGCRGGGRPGQCRHCRSAATPLTSVGVSIGMQRGCQQIKI